MALRVAVLAAAYFTAARLALLLAVQPGFIVAIWPSAGIAVAALLLYGYRLWPGVFLGGLCVNIGTALDAASVEAFVRALILPVGIATGATVQALVGAWLVRRFAGFPIRLDRPGNLLWAMALGGPVSCVISTGVAMALLVHAGLLAAGEVGTAALTWWLGDGVAVLLVLPLASEWRREMAAASLRGRLRVGIPILLAACVTVVGFLSVRATEARHQQQEFARRAQIMARTVDTALQAKFEVVQDLAAVLATFEEIAPERFHALVRDALDRHEDLQALGWNRVVAHDDVAALEAEARVHGLEGFFVKEAQPDGSLVPVRPRGADEPHVVVFYIEPHEGNERARGYDVASNPDRSSAIQAVVDTNDIAITPPIRLVQEDGEQYGFLLFAPVHKGRPPGGGEVPPGTQPHSYAVGVFRAGDLITKSLATSGAQRIRYRVADTTTPAEARPLLPGPTETELAAERVPPMRWSEELSVPGRRWTVSFWPTADYGEAPLWGRAWLALTGGLLCTCLLGVYLLVQAGRAAATARTNQELRLRMDERRRAEAALGASEHQYRTLVKNLPGAVYRCTPDDDWKIRFVSDEMTVISGYPVESFYGRDGQSYSQIIHPDDLAYVRRTVASAVAAREPFVCEYRILTADDEVRWVYEKGQAILGEDGEPKWLDGVVVDVTQHRLAEEALRESEAMLAEAQRIGQMGSWEYDVVSERLVWSDEAYRLLDVERSQAAPDFAAYLARVHPEDRPDVQQHLDAAVDEQEPYEIEHRVLRQDGRVAHLRSAAEIQRDGEGRPRRLVGTLQDVTQRVELQAEQRRLEARMQDAQKLESLGVLAGGIAHDFNNILTSVLGHADLALEELPPDAPARDRLCSIETATRRAADLCQQMLAYSGRGQFVVETLDLRRVVEDMSGMLRASISKNAELRLAFAPDLPRIRGDAAQLRQVVLNLVTNASEALEGEPGLITLATGAARCDKSCEHECYGAPVRRGRKVFLEVADTGCGMPREVLARLFEPFYTTKFTGRGLGMAATLGIVRGHQAGMRVYTREGHGTRVRICFSPVAEEAPVRGADVADTPVRPGDGTILLVDDEAGVREVAQSMLETLGYDVVSAADGEEGLARYRENRARIVAVLLDLTMPRMGGKETFRELRRIDPDVRVILSSGYSGQSVMSGEEDANFACFIQKPYRLATLRDALQKALVGAGDAHGRSGNPWITHSSQP